MGGGCGQQWGEGRAFGKGWGVGLGAGEGCVQTSGMPLALSCLRPAVQGGVLLGLRRLGGGYAGLEVDVDCDQPVNSEQYKCTFPVVPVTQVWNMDQLRRYMGEAPFNRMWGQMQRSAALAVVAALPRVKVGGGLGVLVLIVLLAIKSEHKSV